MRLSPAPGGDFFRTDPLAPQQRFLALQIKADDTAEFVEHIGHRLGCKNIAGQAIKRSIKLNGMALRWLSITGSPIFSVAPQRVLHRRRSLVTKPGKG